MNWRAVPHAWSINVLASALAVSKPALAKMFGDKAGFHAAVLRHYHGRLMSPLYAALDAVETVEDVAQSYLDHFLAGLSAKPVGPNTGCLLAATTEACAGTAGPVAETAAALNERTLRALVQALDQAGAADPEGLARYLFGQGVALAFLSRTGAGPDDLLAFRDRALRGARA